MGEWTYSAFPFQPGEKGGSIDEKVMPPGTASYVLNGVYDKQGAIQKRNGFSIIGADVSYQPGQAFGTAFSQVKRVFSNGDQLCAVAGASGVSEPVMFTRDTSSARWSPRARCANWVVERDVISDRSGGPSPAIAVNSVGMIGVLTSDEDNGVQFSVLDGDTRAPLFAGGGSMVVPTIVGADVVSTRVIAQGRKFILLFSRTGANDIAGIVWDGSTTGTGYVGWGALVAGIVSNGGAGGSRKFDAIPWDATYFILAHFNAGQAYLTQVSVAGLVASTTGGFGAADTDIAVTGTRTGGVDYLVLVWSDSATTTTAGCSVNYGTWGVVAAQTFTATLAASSLGVCVRSSTNAVATYNVDRGATYPTCFDVASRYYNFTSAAAPGVGRPVVNARVVGHPIARDGQAYAVVTPGPSSSEYLFRSLSVVRLATASGETPYPVATFGLRDSAVSFCPHPPARTVSVGGVTTTDEILFLAPRNETEALFSLSLYSLQPTHLSRWLPAKHAQYTALGGGVPVVFDGSFPKEVGFVGEPFIVYATPAGVGVVNGTFSYVTCLVYVDKRGHLHRSAPSNVVTRSPVNEHVILRAALPVLSQLDANNCTFKVELYRTTNGGSTFYLIDGNVAPAFPSRTGYVDIDDNLATTPTDAAQLYTTGVPGDPLENLNAPTCRAMAVWRNRLVMAGCDDAGVIFFSKEFVGGEAPATNDALTVRCDDGGRIMGLAALDERLIVLCERAIFEVAGLPFNDVGVGDLQVMRVTAETGCSDERSVVATPLGVMFRSPRGIVMLDRTGGVVDVGWQVQDRINLYPVVTSAVLLEDAPRVAFTVETFDAEDGEILVYDFKTGAWSTFRLRNAESPMVSACVWRGAYVCASEPAYGDECYLDEGSPGLDGSSWYGMTVRSGWLALLGLTGFYRARRVGVVGEWRGAHKLTMSVDYGYSTTLYPTTTRTFTSAELSANAEKVQIRLAPQKVDAIRLTVSEVAHTTPTDGETLTLTGLSVEWMPRRGMLRQQASAKK